MNVPIDEALRRTDDINEFYKLIAPDASWWWLDNPIADEWREKYCKPLESGKFSNLDVLELEDRLDYELNGGYCRHYPYAGELKAMSVMEKAQMVNGVEWTAAYRERLRNPLQSYLADRWMQLRDEAGLPDMSHKFIGGYERKVKDGAAKND